MKLTELFDRALAARAVLAAVELDLFTLLEGRALSPADLAREAGASERGVAALVEALAAEGFLRWESHRRVSLAGEGARLSRKSADWRGAIAFREKEIAGKAERLADAVRSGAPAPGPAREPQALMAETLAAWQSDKDRAERVAALLEPRGKKRVLALGAASTPLLPSLLARDPATSVLLMDHPIALDVARKLLPREAQQQKRLVLKAGHFLEDVPPAGFDMVLLSDTATHLSPVEVRRVLGRAHASLVEGGTLALRDRTRCKAPAAIAAVEAGIATPEDPTAHAADADAARRDALYGLRLLVEAPGASLHERADLEAWALGAGFLGLRWKAVAADPDRAILLGEKSVSPAIVHPPPPAV